MFVFIVIIYNYFFNFLASVLTECETGTQRNTPNIVALSPLCAVQAGIQGPIHTAREATRNTNVLVVTSPVYTVQAKQHAMRIIGSWLHFVVSRPALLPVWMRPNKRESRTRSMYRTEPLAACLLSGETGHGSAVSQRTEFLFHLVRPHPHQMQGEKRSKLGGAAPCCNNSSVHIARQSNAQHNKCQNGTWLHLFAVLLPV